MRMLMRTYIEARDGSEALKSGAMQKAIMGFMEAYKPEAAYYTAENGIRGGIYVFDMNDSSLMPHVSEPFFSLGCRVVLVPCMSHQDLTGGLTAADL